jgi:quinol monooxygenase YgiN
VPDEPDAFYLYEAYADQAAFDAHKDGEPYKKFVAEIVPEVLEPVIFVFPFAHSVASVADA